MPLQPFDPTSHFQPPTALVLWGSLSLFLTMTSESSTRRSQFSKVRLTFASRQAASNGFQVLGIGSPKIISRPSKRFSRNSELKGDHGLGDAQSLSIRGPSPETQPQTINVILFGETGVGKSSVINLIARKEIAKVSSDVNGCTMQYQCYDISFDNMDFAIFDTIGLEEPQMGVNGYLKAIEKAYELIGKLSAAGGIHLLLFCMRGGRITATTQSNYRLFCECLCNTKVPIALVFTGLEREAEMEDWWRRNKTHIEHYGIKSDGHACITAVQDDTPGEEHKYEESQETIRKLLNTCARKGEAFSLESHSWFARIARQMKSFVPAKRHPKKKDILKVLTHRCKLDADTAKRIAEMMDNDDTEKDPQPGEGKGGKNGPTKKPTNDDTPPGEQDKPKAVSGAVGNGGKDVTKNVADSGLPQEPGNAKAVPGVVANDVVKKNVAGDAPLQEPSDVKAALVVVPGKEVAQKDVADGALLQEPTNVEAAPGVVPNGGKAVTKKNVAEDAPVQGPSNGKAASGVISGKEATKKIAVDRTLPQEPGSVRTALNVVSEKEATKKIAVNRTLPQEPGSVRTALNVVSEKEAAKKNVAEDAPVGKIAFGVVSGKEVTKKIVVDRTLPQEPSSVRTALDVVSEKEVAKKNVADRTLLQGPSNVKAAPDVVPNGGKDATKNVAEDAPAGKTAFGVVSGKEVTKKNVADGTLPQEPSNAKAALDVVPEKEAAKKNVADRTLLQGPSIVKAAPGVVPNGGKDVAKKSVAQGGVPFPLSNFKAVGKSRERGNDGPPVAKVERLNTKKQGDSSTAGITLLGSRP